VVEAEEVGEDFLVYFGAGLGAGVVGGEGGAGAGFGVEGGPVFGPLTLRVNCRVGGEDGAVEFFVGEFLLQPGGALVVPIEKDTIKIVPRGSLHDHDSSTPDNFPITEIISLGTSARDICWRTLLLLNDTPNVC
jgi:hypothetical protein